MRLKAIAATICVLAAVVPSAALAATHHHKKKTKPSYYLALGDSLARGAQPNKAGVTLPTNEGYANDIFAARRHHIKGLKLKELGCLGETTTTMIKGGCPDKTTHNAKGSQLAQAVAFIKTHKVAFITLDIGANDIDGCVQNGNIDTSCLNAGLAAVKANVPTIVKALRKAAGPHVRIVAMTYYDPFLADYLAGSQGQNLAAESVDLAKEFNGELTSGFAAGKLKVADVADAFDTYAPFSKTTTAPGIGTVPVSVAEICEHTWMCAPTPVGPNIHATKSGYSMIADAFEKVL